MEEYKKYKVTFEIEVEAKNEEIAIDWAIAEFSEAENEIKIKVEEVTK